MNSNQKQLDVNLPFAGLRKSEIPETRHTIDVFGSCVSLMWMFLPFIQKRVREDAKVLLQQNSERHSILSAITPPVPVDINSLDWTKYVRNDAHLLVEKRIAHLALNKPFFHPARKIAEYLILDCCSERFDMLFLNDSIIDDNIEASMVRDFLSSKGQVARFSKIDYIMSNRTKVENEIKEFCKRLLRFYAEEKIIINKVLYATKTIDDGLVGKWELKKENNCNRANFVINWFYEQLIKNLPNCAVFTPPADICADRKYPPSCGGGNDGVHLEQRYYFDFYTKILMKMRQDEDNDIRRALQKMKHLEALNNELSQAKNAVERRCHEQQTELAVLCERVENLTKDLNDSLQRNARYHKMSKDPLITLYRKIRRTLGTWRHS